MLVLICFHRFMTKYHSAIDLKIQEKKTKIFMHFDHTKQIDKPELKSLKKKSKVKTSTERDFPWGGIRVSQIPTVKFCGMIVKTNRKNILLLSIFFLFYRGQRRISV